MTNPALPNGSHGVDGEGEKRKWNYKRDKFDAVIAHTRFFGAFERLVQETETVSALISVLDELNNSNQQRRYMAEMLALKQESKRLATLPYAIRLADFLLQASKRIPVLGDGLASQLAVTLASAADNHAYLDTVNTAIGNLLVDLSRPLKPDTRTYLRALTDKIDATRRLQAAREQLSTPPSLFPPPSSSDVGPADSVPPSSTEPFATIEERAPAPEDRLRDEQNQKESPLPAAVPFEELTRDVAPASDAEEVGDPDRTKKAPKVTLKSAVKTLIMPTPVLDDRAPRRASESAAAPSMDERLSANSAGPSVGPASDRAPNSRPGSDLTAMERELVARAATIAMERDQVLPVTGDSERQSKPDAPSFHAPSSDDNEKVVIPTSRFPWLLVTLLLVSVVGLALGAYAYFREAPTSEKSAPASSSASLAASAVPSGARVEELTKVGRSQRGKRSSAPNAAGNAANPIQAPGAPAVTPAAAAPSPNEGPAIAQAPVVSKSQPSFVDSGASVRSGKGARRSRAASQSVTSAAPKSEPNESVKPQVSEPKKAAKEPVLAATEPPAQAPAPLQNIDKILDDLRQITSDPAQIEAKAYEVSRIVARSARPDSERIISRLTPEELLFGLENRDTRDLEPLRRVVALTLKKIAVDKDDARAALAIQMLGEWAKLRVHGAAAILTLDELAEDPVIVGRVKRRQALARVQARLQSGPSQTE